MFVTDTRNHRVQKFTNGGTFLTAWGISDARVQVFDNGGTYLMTLGSNGTGPFYGPYGLAVDGAGYVFIADSLASVIYKFSSTGTLFTHWGGQFTNPEGLSLGPTGDVFVVDAGDNRMERFDNNGTFLSMWGARQRARAVLWRHGCCCGREWDRLRCRRGQRPHPEVRVPVGR